MPFGSANLASEGCNGGVGCGWADLSNGAYTWDLVAGTYTIDPSAIAVVAMQGSGAIARGNSWYEQLIPDEVFLVSCGPRGFPIYEPTCSDWKDGENTCNVEGNRFWAATKHQIVGEAGVVLPASNSGSLKCNPPPPEPSCGEGDDDGREYACEGGGGGGGGSNYELVCSTEFISLEISYNGGETWEFLWEGYAEVCEYYETFEQ